MAPSTLSKTCVLLLSLITGSRSECSETKRVRKPWHSLSDDDQMLYVRGFQQMSREGTLANYIKAHQTATGGSEYNVHKSSQNLFWHSYWLYELENGFRDLGGEYECFTLPYWDVTMDGEYWLNTENPDINDIPIYDGNLGGEGDIDNNMCVGSPWTVEDYPVKTLCADDEVSPDCCLKRLHRDLDDLDRPTVHYSRDQIGQVVFTNPIYQTFNKFAGKIGGFHGDIHSFYGAAAGTHFCGDGAGAPTYEPLFPIFHTFIDYLRLLHEDCNQFDTLNVDRLDDVPEAFEADYGGADCPLDYVMEFSILCVDDAKCVDTDITPRLMFDVSPNTDFGIVYELGDFWFQNDDLKTQCADSLNTTWWRGARRKEEGEAVVSGHVLSRSSNHFMTVGVVVFLLVGAVAMATLKACASSLRKKQGILSTDPMAYGTV
jgi:hypothetical protein